MRALVLLLASVVLLATVQFSYITASSKWLFKPTDVKSNHKPSPMKDRKSEAHNRHDHPYESSHDGHGKQTPALDHNSENKDSKGKVQESNQLSSYKPFVPPYIESTHTHNHYNPEDSFKPGDDHLASEWDEPNVRVERVERPHKSLEPRKGKDKYRKDDPFKMKERKSGGDLPHKGHTENSHYKLKKKSKHHKKSGTDTKHSKKAKKECIGDKDCRGGCCVPTKNGKKYCKKASVKTNGDKCASSCVCKSELRCFVGEYKNNGATKRHKDKNRILGRCINPDVADYNNGYFVDEMQMIQ